MTETDGRKARRDRNRTAVIDSMITLLLKEGAVPSADVVAERAGVSVSSLFRYFDNLEDLQRNAVETYFERFGPLFEIPSPGEGPLPDRIARFVDARSTLHSTVAPAARVTRTMQPVGSPITERLSELRSTLHRQVLEHFGPELSVRSRAERSDLADTIDVLTSFEAWDLLHTTHGRSTRDIVRGWTSAIEALLGP